MTHYMYQEFVSYLKTYIIQSQKQKQIKKQQFPSLKVMLTGDAKNGGLAKNRAGAKLLYKKQIPQTTTSFFMLLISVSEIDFKNLVKKVLILGQIISNKYYPFLRMTNILQMTTETILIRKRYMAFFFFLGGGEFSFIYFINIFSVTFDYLESRQSLE